MKSKSDELLSSEQAIKVLAVELNTTDYQAIIALSEVTPFDSSNDRKLYRESQLRAFAKRKLLRE